MTSPALSIALSIEPSALFFSLSGRLTLLFPWANIPLQAYSTRCVEPLVASYAT